MTKVSSGVLSHKYELISFLLPLVVYVLTLKENIANGVDALDVLTQYSLWTTGSPSLGPISHPIIPDWAGFLAQIKVDTIISNGQYFSVYAPGMSYLSAPFGVVGFLLNGGKLGLHSWAILTDEGFVAICAALAALVVYKVCRMYAPPIPSLLASLTLAFGTIAWPFATELFDHDVAMLFSLLGVYCVIRCSRLENARNERYVALAAAGASFGIACTVEYLSALLILPLIVFLAYRKKLSVFSGLLFGAIFSLGPILDLAYNQLVTGSPLVFPEDLWSGASGLTALSRFEPSQLLTVPLYNLLSPYRGLLLLSPVLFVGTYGLFRMYQSGRFRGDALVLLSLFLLGLIPYSMWSNWEGGYSFGPRFLIDVIPYLVIPVAFALSENRARYTKTLKVIFPSLFVISSFIAGAAAFTSASPQSETSLLYYLPTKDSIPWLLQNDLDVWWHRFHPHFALVIVPLCFILIWAVVGRLLSSIPVETSVPPSVSNKKGR
jgi:hypothetical protein